MNQIFATFLERLPGAVATIGIALFTFFMFKEYKAIRRETAESVRSYVNMVIGDMTASLQAQVARLEGISTRQEMRLKEIDNLYASFNEDLNIKQKEVSKSYGDVEEKFKQLMEAIPSVDEFSARDIYSLAISQDNSRTRAELCTKILHHPDASSRELEVAGDMMRQNSRNTLALALYKKAVQLDPERKSAQIELLALQIELNPNTRDQSISVATELVLKLPDKVSFCRIINALIEIDRFRAVLDISRQFQKIVAGKDQDLNSLALRNIAVALRQLGNYNESAAAYKEALRIHPNDENILKPYLDMLMNQQDYEAYFDVASRLIKLDPSDISYYLLYINALLTANRYSEANEWIQQAKPLIQNPTDEASIYQYERRAEAAARFRSEGKGLTQA